MSDAQRTADTLATGRDHIRTAVNAAGRHRSRDGHRTFPQHIMDLEALTEAMAATRCITGDLALLAKDCADDARAHYFHGHSPTGNPWPEPLKQAAGDADRALTRLRNHLNRAPVQAAHDALSVLHGFVRDVQRADARRTA